MRYGLWPVHTLLRREAWPINHKGTHRIYCEEGLCEDGLTLRHKRPRGHVATMHWEAKLVVASSNEAWSMDFVADGLSNGRRIRALTVVDNLSREALAITFAPGLRGGDVVALMEWLRLHRPAPARTQVDEGSEFISRGLDKLTYDHGVEFGFSRPGKPISTPFIESFTGSFRDERLNIYSFGNRLFLSDA